MPQQTKLYLQQLQTILETTSLWSPHSPSPKALASIEPFAVDTLKAEEWLQWIFIPKMRALINANLPLPSQIMISPYIEEALKEHPNLPEILTPILEIEEYLHKEA